MSVQRLKELAEKKKIKVAQYYKAMYEDIKNYKFNKAASANFCTRAFEQRAGRNK